MDPTVRPFPHSDLLFGAFKVDPTKFAEHVKPRLEAKSYDVEKDLEANPSS